MQSRQDLYIQRRKRVSDFLASRNIAAARFEDFEGHRDPSVRYLCGHPGDAALVISAQGSAVLVPWDVNMAKVMASIETVLPYTQYGRKPETALQAALAELGVPAGSRIELSSTTPYPAYIDHVAALPDFDFVCEKSGSDAAVRNFRGTKDEGELAIYSRAAALTNELMDRIEAGVRKGQLSNETEVALFIESEARMAGAEGTGFDTIAAGPGRSFGIHAFPSYGAGPFGTRGMSILDFGIVLDGYTTDVTMSFVRGPLSATQERMIGLVGEAYRLGVAACTKGNPAREVARIVDSFFAQAGFVMPHALGHGVGLEAHEYPGINLREENSALLECGQIVTIEPGLYHPGEGGVRLENDVLISESGPVVLTSSRIVRL